MSNKIKYTAVTAVAGMVLAGFGVATADAGDTTPERQRIPAELTQEQDANSNGALWQYLKQHCDLYKDGEGTHWYECEVHPDELNR